MGGNLLGAPPSIPFTETAGTNRFYSSASATAIAGIVGYVNVVTNGVTNTYTGYVIGINTNPPVKKWALAAGNYAMNQGDSLIDAMIISNGSVTVSFRAVPYFATEVFNWTNGSAWQYIGHIGRTIKAMRITSDQRCCVAKWTNNDCLDFSFTDTVVSNAVYQIEVDPALGNPSWSPPVTPPWDLTSDGLNL